MRLTPTLSARIHRLLRLGTSDWLALGRASYELARARLCLGRIDPRRFQETPSPGERPPLTASDLTHIIRVRLAISRAARLVPWRSTCLIQAEAARHWLAAYNLQSETRIGVRKTHDNQLDAHAWLICGGEIVTGGDVTPFSPLA